jgi:hypothetical protein
MKVLFSRPDPGAIGLIRASLDEAGIAYVLRNETMPYPLAPFQAELWVLDDLDFSRACELRDAVLKVPAVSQPPWTCPLCGEKLENQFGSCWKCGANRPLVA